MKRRTILTILCICIGIINAQNLYDINTITTVELTFSQSNWDQLLDNLYAAGDEERLVGSAVINGVAFDSVGVRYKGNSSYSSQNAKNPLNIKLDHIIDNQTYDGYGTLKLANGYKDPSFVRETLGYEIARTYMPASQANYADVYINGTHIGLYTSVQDVDKQFKNEHFNADDDIRFKGELSTGGQPVAVTIWDYLGADSSAYANYYEIESDTGWDDLISFLDVFNNTPEEMASVLDVDAHLWMLAFDNLIVNLDSPINFGHNYYLFKNGADQFSPIIWDLNESFGVFSMLLGGSQLGTTQMQQMDPLLNMNNSDYPIVGNVLSNAQYQRMYIAHMRTIINEIFASGWYEARANELQDIIDVAYQADVNTFYTYTQFQQNVNSAITSGGGPGPMQSIVGLTQLMESRYQWLLSQPEFQGTVPQISAASITPDAPAPGSEVWITTTAIDADDLYLYYRNGLSGNFNTVAMYDDGMHNDGSANDDIFGGSLQAGYQDIQYYFYGENSQQGAFLPARSAKELFTLDVITDSGELVINEINYHSSDDFNPEDWVELYNPSDEALDLSAWQFKDENDDHIYSIPDGTTLDAGAYLVLCHDLTLFSALFPAVDNAIGDFDFGLSGGGEPIRIFDPAGTLIDSVDYDDEGDWPTLPDGNGNTLELIDPGYDNALASSWQASLGYGTPGEENSAGVAVSNDVSAITQLSLSCYPNPFNPSTTVSFVLQKDESTHTQLAVYNIRGQKVKTLLSESLASGTYTVEWNGTDSHNSPVGSGVYFCQLQSGGATSVHKMMLMK